MSAPTRQWNVVAGLAVIVVLMYLGAAVAAFFLGRIDGAAFREMALPVVTAVCGYLAALLNQGGSS